MNRSFDLLSLKKRVVADANDGYLLVFDAATNEFLLAQFFNDAIHSIGVRGDAVGCFMAR